MRHRPEIDGLRAVAVVPVVLFHAGSGVCTGGYAGVDVFFVISGYLITSIILEDLSRGTFTFLGFYERRMRRIMPALFCMLLLTAIAAWFALLPPALRMFGLSAAAAALSVSNIYFFRITDYFAPATDHAPLVHTWSLGIEEQFYLLFPALAVLLWGRRWALPALLLLAGASLALAHWGATAHPAAGFYLLHTRAWELLAGATLAYRSQAVRTPPRLLCEVLAASGLIALAATYTLYDRQTPFPSLAAVLPVAGTALIIAYATPETIAGRLLSWRPIVFIGLISYSTYLWHQPLLAFARHLWMSEPPAHVLAALSLVAFGLGAISWRAVEQPFRDKARISRARVFAFAAACTVLTVAFGAASLVSNGFRSTLDPDIIAYLETERHWANDPCHIAGAPLPDLAAACILGDARNVVGVLIGDSHAAAVAQGLGEALKAHGLGVLQLTLNGCPPIPDVYRADFGLSHPCAEFHTRVNAVLASSPSLTHVIVVSRWTRFLQRSGFNNGEGGIEVTSDRIEHLADGRPAPMPEKDRVALMERKVAATVRHLLDLGKGVIVAYPIPEVGWDAPSYLARRALIHKHRGGEFPPASTSLAAFTDRNQTAFAMLDRIGTHPRLARVYPHRAFCDRPLPGRCVFQSGNTSLYTDHNHVSLAGARMLVPDIAAALSRQILRGP